LFFSGQKKLPPSRGKRRSEDPAILNSLARILPLL
jgi:hypothetical protein